MKYDIDIIADNLMLPEDELRAKGIEEQKIQRIIRLRDIYNYMLRNPLKKDREYIDYVQSRYVDEHGKPIAKRTAYQDIEVLHAIVGNLQQCTKEWHRWRFNNMIMEGYVIALRQNDAAAIAKLAGQYGKYNKLDKEDEHDRGYGQLPKIHFTFDVEVMGFKAIPNVFSVMDRLYAEFTGTRLENIAEDADALEIFEEPDKNNRRQKTLTYADAGSIPE